MSLKRIICFVLILFTSKSFAVNLQGFYFSDSYKYAIVEDAFLLKNPGDWLFYSSLGFVNHPFVVANAFTNDNEGVVLSNQKILTAGFTYNLDRSLSLGVDTSFIMTEFSDDASSIGLAQTAANAEGYSLDEGNNIGDISFKAKWRFFQDKETKTAIALIPKITLGTGSEETLTSSESTGWSLMAVGEKLWTRLAIQGAVGYTQTSNAELADLDYDKVVNLQAAISYRILTDFNINLEIIRNVTVGEEGNSEQDSGDYYGTFKWKLDPQYDIYGGLGLAGFTDIDEENYTVFAGLKFHPGRKSKRAPRVNTNNYLEKISDQYVQAGRKIRPVDANLKATGRDADAKGNKVAYSCVYDREDDGDVIDGNPCTKLDRFYFDAETGIVDWTIPEGVSGKYEFLIEAYLNGNQFDSESFVVTVASREAEKELGALFKADRVYFDNSSSKINKSEQRKLSDIAKYLKSNKLNVSKVIIEGYASKVGSSSFNKVLSAQRSLNVMKFLLERGVDADLIQTIAYGDDYQNEEPEHWQNRRVEFRIYNKR